MTRYRGGTYSPTVGRVRFADGAQARTDLIRLNPDVGAYSLDFNGMVTDSPTVYRPHSWDEVTGAYAARFRSAAISALLAQSYPHVGLAELSSRLRAAGYPLNCGNLREHQAIAATQAAIWRLTNNLSLDTAPVDVPIGVTTITSDGGTVVEVEFAEPVVLGGFALVLGSDLPADRFAVRLLKPTGHGWATVGGSTFTTNDRGQHQRRLGEAATISEAPRGSGPVGYRTYRIEVSGAGRVTVGDLRFCVSGAPRFANEAPIVALYEYLLAGTRATPAADQPLPVQPWVLLADDDAAIGLTPLITLR
ncbi:MAG TPA: TQXA domain-containing protein [Gordonia sp. (in: high G+C Gram-positive bacteria)]|uniref:TQXA domain-containing protein n=1 Tax=unclassified Gordonia (in: high G+C Gram-positive bacteria) TaxID=2657482 RepID=UPI0025BC46A3|nr:MULTISPECIES: TQXA domain-containing protein [unclassified Gordonia (in: high G+C Gram-positive bacteria)]HNP56855.1 TQXA domain-containing protein [Gordonia sp. (in: high G+C Gram-positive bacteria)]HRC49815.1 TQXA domain-containing protein [Gordonia sp. (in: high G+C Gram-positive bacteria)]